MSASSPRKKAPAKAAKKAPTKPKTPASTSAPEVSDVRFSDKLIADLELTAPANAPAMYKFHQLNRRQRAEMARQLGVLIPAVEKSMKAISDEIEAEADREAAGEPESGSVTDLARLKAGADSMALFADIEDFLASIAVDADALRKWATEADDMDILALFSEFARSFGRGEANSSSI